MMRHYCCQLAKHIVTKIHHSFIITNMNLLVRLAMETCSEAASSVKTICFGSLDNSSWDVLWRLTQFIPSRGVNRWRQ